MSDWTYDASCLVFWSLCVWILCPPLLWLLYLFGFVLLMVAWRYQTVGIDAFIIGRCVAMGTGVGLLHCKERVDALYFSLVTAVCQGLSFGSQATPRHPLSVLLLLEGERQSRESERAMGLWSEMWDSGTKTSEGRRVCVCSHVFTAQIDLVHSLRCWYQEFDKELLCGHVNVWSHFTSCVWDEYQSNI